MTMSTESSVFAAVEVLATRTSTIEEIIDTNRKLSELWGRLVHEDGREVDVSGLEEEFRRNQENLALLRTEIDVQLDAIRAAIVSAEQIARDAGEQAQREELKMRRELKKAEQKKNNASGAAKRMQRKVERLKQELAGFELIEGPESAA